MSGGKREHPFPYLGHGVAAARKTMSCTVCFAEKIAKADRKAIERGIPEPLADDFSWGERIFSFGNDNDSIQWVVKACYEHVEDPDHDEDPEFPSDAQWRAFNDDIDTWILKVHEKFPVAFFLKPIDDEFSTETDEWHDWSMERMPSMVLPHAEAFSKRDNGAIEYSAELWKWWVGEQAAEKQKQLLEALTREESAALKKLKALPKGVKQKPEFDPLPTLEEALALWRRLLAENPEGVERRYEEAASEGKKFESEYYGINDVVFALREAKDLETARTVTKQAIAGGVQFPSNWWTTLAEIEMASKDTVAAESAVREVIWRIESYSSGMLMVALDFEEARGNKETAAMLFHAGKRWFTLFTSNMTKARAKKYGTAPKNLPALFTAWLESWIGDRWAEPISRDSLAHWSVWFDSIDPKSRWKTTLDEIRAKGALPYEKMRQAKTAEQAAAALEALLAAPHNEEGLLQAAYIVQAFAPETALTIYERIVSSKESDRDSYSYRVAFNNHFFVCLASKSYARAEAIMAEALAAAPENASIFYNAACIAARQDDRATAFERIRLAIAHEFERPKQIHDDEDFQQWRGDPEFEALFPAEKKTPAKKSAPKTTPGSPRRGK